MAKYTIRQIAELAGVSAASVSRILSGKAGKYRISQATIDKVLGQARELDYQPNYLAQALNTRRTWNIGMVFANTVDSFLGSIMEGAEEEFRKTEYLMSVATCENTRALEAQALRRFAHRQVDGVIVYPSAARRSGRAVASVKAAASDALPPCVVIGRDNGFASDKVLFDDFKAGEIAATDFLKAGAKSFGIVSLPIDCSSNKNRIEGFKSVLLAAGVEEAKIVSAGLQREPWLEPLDSLAKADAVFGVNASTLVRTALKLSALRDIRSLLFWTLGSIDFPGELRFKFKYLPMPAKEMGRVAAKRLMERIGNPSLPSKTTVLPWPELEKVSGL